MKVVIFPGQGIDIATIVQQTVQINPDAKKYFDKASEIFAVDLIDVMELKSPIAVQALIYASGCALVDYCNIEFDFAAGHSLGQYCAMYACKMMSYEKGLEMLKCRALAMQKACEREVSGMVACLGTGDVEMLAKVTGCQIANYNSSTQTILSGTEQQLEEVMIKCRDYGLKCMRLSVAGGYHSMFMKGAAEEFEGYLKGMESIKLSSKLISNSTARPMMNVKQELVNHVFQPVLWKQSLDYINKVGIERGDVSPEFVECSVSGVLSRFMTRDGWNVRVC